MELNFSFTLKCSVYTSFLCFSFVQHFIDIAPIRDIMVKFKIPFEHQFAEHFHVIHVISYTVTVISSGEKQYFYWINYCNISLISYSVICFDIEIQVFLENVFTIFIC